MKLDDMDTIEEFGRFKLLNAATYNEKEEEILVYIVIDQYVVEAMLFVTTNRAQAYDYFSGAVDADKSL